MAAKICLDCTAVYTTDADKCPQCGSTRSRFDWDEPEDAKPQAAGGTVSADDPVHVVQDGPAPFVVPPGPKGTPTGTVTAELPGADPDAKAGA